MTSSSNLDHRLTMLVASVLVLLALPAVAQPVADGLRLSIVDTLRITDLELRGLAWISDDTILALVADPDSTPGSPPLSTTLVWSDGDGNVLREFDVTGLLSRGLAYDGEWLWSLADPTSETGALLVQLEPDTLYVEQSYELPGHRPTDIAWDGNSFWIVDHDRGRLDRFDLDSEDVTRSRPSPGFSPSGVAHDGHFLWISDFGTGRLDRLSKGGSVWNGTVSADSYFRRGEEIALVWGQGSLWLLPAGTGYLLRVEWE